MPPLCVPRRTCDAEKEAEELGNAQGKQLFPADIAQAREEAGLAHLCGSHLCGCHSVLRTAARCIGPVQH